MKNSLKILLLEDSRLDAEMIQRMLLGEKMNCEFKLAMNKKSFLTALDEFSPHVILSDHSLPQFNSSKALEIAREKLPDVPFIMVTGAVSEEFAASIIKQGADDYILKDRMARLPAAILTALNQRRITKEISDYKYALDQAAIVAITDQKGIITYANENFSRISKYSIMELVGKDHRIINSGHHPAFYIKNMWVTIAHGNIWRGEFCNKAKDGELYWVDTTIIPFLDDKQKPYQYLSIRTDITSKKRGEEYLQKSERRLKEAQSVAHLGNYEADLIENVHTWSDEYFSIFGIDKLKDSPSLELFLSFIHPDEMVDSTDKIKDIFSNYKDSSREFRFIRRDGTVRHAYSEWKFEFDKKGRATRVYGIVQDITERKEAEEKVKQLQEDLMQQQKIEQLKIIATALEAQEKERHAIGMELHDNVNQILVGTNLFLSMVKRNPEKGPELIASSMKNLQEAIEENRKIAHVFVAPDLEHVTLIKQLKYMTGKMLDINGIKTNFQTDDFNEKLVNPERKINIYRIAQEQCTNIVKYAKATRVDITLLTKNGELIMTIKDNGVGMEKGKVPTGIGLRNISGRLSIFNGSSEIITAKGKGFSLSVTLSL